MSQRTTPVDPDATVDHHFAQIRLKGESYLAHALKRNPQPVLRQRLLLASLRYFETRSQPASTPSQISQPSPGPLVSPAVSSFQTLLASALDHDIPSNVLIEACAKAADCQLSTVLVKLLYILASAGPIREDSDAEKSQSQYDDDELFNEIEPDGDQDQENLDPQKAHPRPLKPPLEKKAAPKPKPFSMEVSVGRTGQSFVDEFMSKLVAGPESNTSTQTKSNDVFVSSVAREAPLSDAASRNVIRSLTRRMKTVNLFELPAFIYQVLLFASARGTAAEKSYILLQITRVFAEMEKKTRKMAEFSQSLLEEDEDAIMSAEMTTVKDLRQVQGTALLHIEYAVKQDPSLSTEIVKLTKSGVETPGHFLTTFGTGIILSLAKTTASQSDVLSLLRDSIARFGKEMALRQKNMYVARVTLNDDQVVDPRKSLLFVAQCTCESGWDYVMESLMNFAFLLMDKPVLEGADKHGRSDCLGEDILFQLFNGYAVVRESIMEQLTTRIALQEKSTHKAIAVIRRLTEKIPYYVLEYNRYLRDAIELVTSLPPWIAAELISAYKPLLMARQDLRDYFHLVIRKSLFHRDSSSRAVAISGFLTATSLCGSSGKSSSQPNRLGGKASSQQQDGDLDAMLESLQPVRRIFSYPAAQRALLYKNAITALQNVSAEDGSNMAIAISEILRGHLRTFVSPQEAPYVHPEHCVSELNGGYLVEPLGDLIWCLAVCEVTRDADEYGNSYIVDLARKISTVSIQDFPISKDLVAEGNENVHDGEDPATVNSEEAATRANRNRARVLGSVCEGLINSVLLLPEDQLSWSTVAEVLVPLLALKGRGFDLLREAGVSSASDAFSDLGGDLRIELLRPGMRMFLQRTTRAGSSKGKKRPASRKSKPNENSASWPGSPGTSHRFGSFSILSSASSRPTLPLNVIMRVLSKMSNAITNISGSSGNVFQGQTDSRDFQELRSYLLAAALKHVEDFISLMSRENHADSANAAKEIFEAVSGLVRMAMSDFKRFRRTTAPSLCQGGMIALRIAERCTFCLALLRGKDSEITLGFCHALLLKPECSQGRWSTGDILESAVDALEKLIDSLMDDELLKEATIALQMHSALVRAITGTLSGVEKISSFLDKRVLWAREILSSKAVSDTGIIKTIVHVCLVYTENNNDLRRAGHLCQRLLEVIGDCDENAEMPEGIENDDERLVCAKCVQQETSLAVVEAILDVLEGAITDVEWCLNRMASLESAVDNGSIEADSSHSRESEEDQNDAAQQQMVAKQAMRAEDAAQLRLEGVVRTLRGLARCAIAKWGQQERLLKVITKTYRTLCISAHAQSKRRGDPRTSFTSLVNECKGLAPTLWTYLAFVGGETAMDKTSKGASRASKEAKVMPQLIYEVERFEKVLIAVQKKTRINLLRGMRRNIARDFRIREDLLRDESDDPHGNDTTDRAEPESSPSKRRRT
eukprot:GFKZ01012484.1.p1 GENE.GFKZ01012484.1~~GFKZ01012484.1.p1  ORF type:complete len:1447 (-),score=208.20 GFKZ01012484.1:97-4437(-)